MPNEERKTMAVSMRGRGKSHREIAGVLGVSQTTVRYWTNPEYAAFHKRKAMDWMRANKQLVNGRNRERQKNITREEKDRRNGRQRQKYVDDPKVKLRMRLLAAKYRHTSQGNISLKLRRTTLGYAGLYPKLNERFMEAVCGMSREHFISKMSGDGQIDHIVPLVSFDLSNPEHLVRAAHHTNVRKIPRVENQMKGDSGRLTPEEIMKLPWVETQEALNQAMIFIARYSVPN